jgi:hypothetical protein
VYLSMEEQLARVNGRVEDMSQGLTVREEG